MPAWSSILLWWLAFAGSHLLLSSIPVRRPLIEKLGAQAFAGLYSVVALATFVPIVWIYLDNRHSGPLLWTLRGVPGITVLTIVVGIVAFALIAGSFAQPSATSIDPRAVPRARGILRITRHPLFTGLALWGLGHVVVNGFASDLAFFGSFAVFAVIGAQHQDTRKQLEEPQRLGAFYNETSLLPFGAVLEGRNRVVAEEMPWIALVLGAAVAGLVYLAHPWLFTP